MPDGWQYVVVTYALVGATLGVWFWMMGRKLRMLRERRDSGR